MQQAEDVQAECSKMQEREFQCRTVKQDKWFTVVGVVNNWNIYWVDFACSSVKVTLRQLHLPITETNVQTLACSQSYVAQHITISNKVLWGPAVIGGRERERVFYSWIVWFSFQLGYRNCGPSSKGHTDAECSAGRDREVTLLKSCTWSSTF